MRKQCWIDTVGVYLWFNLLILQILSQLLNFYSFSTLSFVTNTQRIKKQARKFWLKLITSQIFAHSPLKACNFFSKFKTEPCQSKPEIQNHTLNNNFSLFMLPQNGPLSHPTYYVSPDSLNHSTLLIFFIALKTIANCLLTCLLSIFPLK